MGLAASQARFLGITLRKANCEFKSTELAQQRLELTNQMTDISQEYSNALNSTKLVWHNEAVSDSFGHSVDMGLSYSLLMMPTAANDYNPYMVTSKTGAIVLSSKYAEAARRAGISMAGGMPSADGRDKFIASLANASFDANGNIIFSGAVTDASGKPCATMVFTGGTDSIITNLTGNILVGAQVVDESADVSWHYAAGMGVMPKNKSGAEEVNLNVLMEDAYIGGLKIDWLQIYKSMIGRDSAITETEKTQKLKYHQDIIAQAKNNYQHNTEIPRDRNYAADVEMLAKALGLELYTPTTAGTGTGGGGTGGTGTGGTVNRDPNIAACSQALDDAGFPYTGGSEAYIKQVMEKFANIERLMKVATNDANKRQYQYELEMLKQGLMQDPSDKNNTIPIDNNPESKYLYPLLWACYEYSKAEYAYSQDEIKFDYKEYEGSDCTSHDVDFDDLLNIRNDARIIDSVYTPLKAADNSVSYVDGITDPADIEKIKLTGFNKLTVCVGEAIMNDQSIIENLTIADLLSNNVVLMSREAGIHKKAIETIEVASQALMKSIAEAFGYGSIGKGINVDEDTDRALNYALEMMNRKFLKAGNAVKIGGERDDRSLMSNSAYKNANEYNRIGSDDNGDYAAVNLSNMVAAFLTYFDNGLRGAESQYVVGKSNDAGSDYSRTNFVTDDPSYAYIQSSKEDLTNDEIMADFYNELYNNICEHGWRQDDMVYDSEYLESAVKDGRYQLMALNKGDGYFYQMRYNDIEYLVEEMDRDAIARAEADYTTKKAQITYKEDLLDMKTKKLDAEIAELNTELNSVQNIISKSIEKTFTMFSS